MGDWKSEQEVFDGAEQAGLKIIELLNTEGIDHAPGAPQFPGSGGWAIVQGLHRDALDVLSRDPQKIIDEFERMQKICRAMSRTSPRTSSTPSAPSTTRSRTGRATAPRRSSTRSR